MKQDYSYWVVFCACVVLLGMTLYLCDVIGKRDVLLMKMDKRNVELLSKIKTYERNIAPELVVLERQLKAHESEMARYETMSIDEFETLPRNERLKYTSYLMDESRAQHQYYAYYGIGSGGEDYAVVPVDTELGNTGQQILDDELYRRQLAYLQYAKGAPGEKTFDPLNGQKMLGIIFYDVGANNTQYNYEETKRQMTTLIKPYVVTNPETVLIQGDIKSGHDGEGKAVQYRIIKAVSLKGKRGKVVKASYSPIPNSSTSESKPVYSRYVYYEYLAYNGEKRAVWLIDAMALSLKDLEAIGTVR